MLASGGIGCRGRDPKPPVSFVQDIGELAAAGKIADSRAAAHEGLRLFGGDAYWRFLFQLYLDAGPEEFERAFLTYPIPDYAKGKRAEVYILWDRAKADAGHRRQWLEQARSVAERIGDARTLASVDYQLAQYWLKDAKDPARAGMILESLVARAPAVNYPQLLGSALVNLSFTRIRLGRYDEAIALCEQAQKALEKNPNAFTMATKETNLGWSLLQLGEPADAMTHFDRAMALYHQLHSGEEVLGLRNQAAVLVRQGTYPKAQDKLEQASSLLEQNATEEQAGLWTDRAEVYVIDKHPDSAREALNKARRLAAFNRELDSQESAHIRFVEAMIAEEAGHGRDAAAGYREVLDAKSPTIWASMRLDAALRRARLVAPAEAERQYVEAEALLEAMRGHLNQDEAKLSFSDESAAKLYDQYVDFLISRGNGIKALQVADRSRGRLLSDYQVDQKAELNLTVLQTRLQPVNGLALFYWLGAERAYVWKISPTEVSPPIDLGASPGDIRALSKKYFDALSTDKAAKDTGVALRDILLAPAKSALAQEGRRVFMILDDTLGLINPEALPGFHSKWWIEEAVVSIAPSLSMLQGTREASTATIPLLAIGDAIGTAEFPRLPGFNRELEKIKSLFPVSQRDVVSLERATPAAYKNANPVRYEMIHFTAHGKAETRNPLDSAVILSAEPDSKAYKLYARDIVKIAIQARLVTISACKSAVSRTYRGEGVVGLAWAFLRSGARQVVAGLWNVDDEASQKLMVSFYRGIREEHKSPTVALHDAKLALMKTHADPYYWAPFEIFAGYVER